MTEEIMNKNQACQYLQISKSLLESLVRENQIPHFRVGKRLLRFKKTSLDSWTNRLEEARPIKFVPYVKPKKKEPK